jgi:hypothetical protein
MSSLWNRIQYVSNLFVDQHRIPFKYLLKTGVAKNLALCGNIGRPTSAKTRHFMDYCAEHWHTTYWIPGPYDISTDGTPSMYYKNIDEMQALLSSYPSITLMNQGSHHMRALNTKVIGATLWTENPVYLKDQPEFRHIYHFRNNGVFPCDTHTYRTWNAEDVQYIQNEMNMAVASEDIIVLTHHLPSRNFLGVVRNDKRITLDSSLDLPLLYKRPTIWLAGASGSVVMGRITGYTQFAMNGCFPYPYGQLLDPNPAYSNMAFVEFGPRVVQNKLPKVCLQ